jgi:hypothetical protein
LLSTFFGKCGRAANLAQEHPGHPQRVNLWAVGGIVLYRVRLNPVRKPEGDLTTVCNMLLLAQLGNVPAGDSLRTLAIIGGVFLLVAAWIAVFLVPILIWRRNARRRGYSGLRAYLRELPGKEEEQMDAVELTLKGMVLCILGLLFPPLVLIGLVPLYYGARKLSSVILGITEAGGSGQLGRSQ